MTPLPSALDSRVSSIPGLISPSNAMRDSIHVSMCSPQVDTFFDSYVSGLQNEAQDAVAEQSPFGTGASGKLP